MINEGQPPGLFKRTKRKKRRMTREGETPLLNPRVLGGRCLYSSTTNSRDHQHSDEGQVSLISSGGEARLGLGYMARYRFERPMAMMTCHATWRTAGMEFDRVVGRLEAAPSRRGAPSSNRMSCLASAVQERSLQTPLPSSSGRTIC